MKVLGAVLAGGRSSRFGSDKALAMLRGRTLLDRAVATLQAQCDAVIIAGHPHGLADWPEPGLGPLGGIGAALHFGRAKGYDAVLTCGVDSLGLPGDLRQRLSPAPACLDAQPIVGLWTADSLATLETMIAEGRTRAVRAFAERVGARTVKTPCDPANVNTREDLDVMEHRHGL